MCTLSQMGILAQIVRIINVTSRVADQVFLDLLVADIDDAAIFQKEK
jgi:hypothetical protein